MMRVALPAILILLAMNLTGCAGPRSATIGTDPEPVALDLVPAGFGGSVVMDQMVTGSFQGQSRSMRVRVEISPERLSMIGLNHVGVPLFTLTHDGAHLDATMTGDNRLPVGDGLPVDPRYVLADFQLAFWPVEALRPALAPRGLVLEVGPDGARRLFDQGGLLLARTSGAPADAMGVPVPELVVTRIMPPYELLIRTRGTGASR